MAKTQISDVIVPEVFNPYVRNAILERSRLVRSGIIVADPALDALAISGGKLINMPFWNDLTGDDEVLSDSGALTPQKIDAAQDVAVLLMRGKAWSANDLAKALSGDDPMRAIADQVVNYWVDMEQKVLISTLGGAFAAASMSANILDISGETDPADQLINGTTFIEAKNKLGDNSDKLTAVAMHSSTFAYLEKQNLISYIPNSQGVVEFPTYMNKKVIVDDGLPVATGVYTTYLFGTGAIGKGEGAAPVPTETDRDSLAGDDILINRRHYLLHPRGVKFTSASVAGASPTNVELATAANWTRVYNPKAIRIVQFKHKIG